LAKFEFSKLSFIMIKYFIAGCCWWFVAVASAQTVSQKLQQAFTAFEKDKQLRFAISSLYVMDAETGRVVFSKNADLGMAPASTQKIITSVTAFELLGKNYQYKTEFGVITEQGKTIFCIKPSGDPSLGSWRWEMTKEQNVLNRILTAVKAAGLRHADEVLVDARGWDSEEIPDGWIWQDIGNYYGAGTGGLNWRENQFDLVLKSGSRIGDAVEIKELIPVLYEYTILSRATTAAKGTGDNAFIYLPVGTRQAMLRGTIPVNEDRFVVSGAMVNPSGQFIQTLLDILKNNLQWTIPKPPRFMFEEMNKKIKPIHTEYSPPLDSIIYWFNKKSINLYGEALIKTLGYLKKGMGTTDSGLVVLKNFWKENGIEEDELNMTDGSGLSPLNRVTSRSQAAILKFAKTRNWFPSFYNSLPEYNGMKMKSGTINGVKAFCGYHQAKNGKSYIFSFMVNNYNGSPTQLVNKMYKVLDVLK